MTTATTSVMGSGGITLAAEIIGNPEAMPVLLAHGGGQTRRAWKRVTNDLANAGFCAIAFDMRGHGDSAWSEAGAYEMLDFATDLVAIATKMGRRPAVVGASLGGLAGLLAEGVLAQGSFASLTLVDIAPRMEPDGVMRVVGFMEQHVETGFASPEEAAEVIAVADTKVATMAVIAMLTGVNTWFREGGRLSLDEVERIYWDMVRKAVGV